MHNLLFASHVTPSFYSSSKNTPLPNLLLKHFLVGHSGWKNSCYILQTSRNDLRPCLTMLVTVMCIKIWKHFSPRYVLLSKQSLPYSPYCCTSNTSSLSRVRLLNEAARWNFPLTQKTKYTNIKMDQMEYESHCTNYFGSSTLEKPQICWECSATLRVYEKKCSLFIW